MEIVWYLNMEILRKTEEFFIFFIALTYEELELFYCNGNIFLEGPFMVVTTRRKWRDFFGTDTTCWENKPFLLRLRRSQDMNWVVQWIFAGCAGF